MAQRPGVPSSVEGGVLGQKASSPVHSLPAAWADPGRSPALDFKGQALPGQTEVVRPSLTHNLPPFPRPGCSL